MSSDLPAGGISEATKPATCLNRSMRWFTPELRARYWSFVLFT